MASRRGSPQYTIAESTFALSPEAVPEAYRKLHDTHEKDRRILTIMDEWRENRQFEGPYAPGDSVGLRYHQYRSHLSILESILAYQNESSLGLRERLGIPQLNPLPPLTPLLGSQRHARSYLLQNSPARIAESLLATLSTAAAIADAVPHWVSSTTAYAAMHSEPPASEMASTFHLQFPKASVLFERPLEVPRTFLHGEDVLAQRLLFDTRAIRSKSVLAGQIRLVNNEARVRIAGMLYSAKSTGDMHGDAMLLLHINGPINRVQRSKGPLAWAMVVSKQELDASKLGPIVRNVASVLTRAEWRVPESVELPEPSQGWRYRRAMRSARVRQGASSGGLAGIRVFHSMPTRSARQGRAPDAGAEAYQVPVELVDTGQTSQRPPPEAKPSNPPHPGIDL